MIDYEKLKAAADFFDAPIKVEDGQCAMVDGVIYIYKNGEWIEKEEDNDK